MFTTQKMTNILTRALGRIVGAIFLKTIQTSVWYHICLAKGTNQDKEEQSYRGLSKMVAIPPRILCSNYQIEQFQMHALCGILLLIRKSYGIMLQHREVFFVCFSLKKAHHFLFLRMYPT